MTASSRPAIGSVKTLSRAAEGSWREPEYRWGLSSEAPAIARRDRGMSDGMSDRREDRLEHRVLKIRQPIVDPEAVLARGDKAGPPEIRQVP